jgi:hypothetical protein
MGTVLLPQNSMKAADQKPAAFSHADLQKIKQTPPIICYVKKDEYGKTE